LSFQVGDGRGGCCAKGADAIELELIGHAAVHPVLEERDRVVRDAQRPAGNIELRVELTKQEIG
jgi:hypothetical protein